MNFKKFHAPFSMRLTQAMLSHGLRNVGSEDAHVCTYNAYDDIDFLFSLSDTTIMAMDF
jgi:hypothetical protein